MRVRGTQRIPVVVRYNIDVVLQGFVRRLSLSEAVLVFASGSAGKRGAASPAVGTRRCGPRSQGPHVCEKRSHEPTTTG